MPIIRQAGEPAGNLRQRSFAQRIRAGRVVPVISDPAMIDMALGGYPRLVEGYAELAGYPMPDRANLVKVAKYRQLQENIADRTLKSDYLNWVKNHIYFTAQKAGADEETLAEAEAEMDDVPASAFARRLGYPQLEGGTANSLLVLANLPVRVFLTTSPHTFLEDALQRAGKEPRTETCRWFKELDGIESAIDAGYRPSAEEPLVYHLHGVDTQPASLVLTVDDHLTFLVNVARGQGNEAADRVPAIVRQALFDDLIVLGYSLSDWAFRGLYAGLIKPSGRQEDRGVCALQLTPSEVEQRYLEDYAHREAKFDVFWGNIDQYAQELLGMMNE